MGESVDSKTNLAVKGTEGRLKVFLEVAAHLRGS